ncbi:hypothetical protein OOK31_35980 [Streptomyces sp. NBC_00249]|uniref:hypothetical protein n=1 Tax=Streptomyces sp. NBC_00249 TaxID=2975690 RepID=UPI00224ED2E5|nr:hypothetical protein [Streptomyces sp. NBC_00249]MCX5199222.1 hypothetical protein [Streptomyces sp. NBC_00249]
MITTPLLRTAAVLAALLPLVAAAPVNGPDTSWNTTEKCVQTDWDNRRIPTRIGNSELGWQHFSRPHGITSCKLINAALDGKPDKSSDQQRNLEYWGSAIRNGRQVDFVVKVRYAKKTDDDAYEAPGAKGKVGVITAYCRGVQKCPTWVN